MAKKPCELCGIKLSTDTLFGIPLCDECRALYSDPQMYCKIKDKEFVKNASERAMKLFLNKASHNDPEILREREEAAQKQREEVEKEIKEKEERKRKEQEDRDAFLKENGYEGYYEYKVLNIVDDRTGCVNISEISSQLNTLGRQGWHLRCAYTNELGKNASSLGVGGVSLGTNSTVDQSILILERFIKFK